MDSPLPAVVVSVTLTGGLFIRVIVLRVDCADVDCPLEDQDVHRGDFVIVTTTAPVTTTITFEPKLSQNKSLALRNANYQPSSKVILVFHTPFWEKEGDELMGGQTVSDLPLKIVYYPLRPSKSGTSNICRLFSNIVC